MKKASKFKVLFDIFHFTFWLKKPAGVSGLIKLHQLSKEVDRKYMKKIEYLFLSVLALFSFNLGYITSASVPQKIISTTLFLAGATFLFLILKKFTTQHPQKRNRESKLFKIIITTIALIALIHGMYQTIKYL